MLPPIVKNAKQLRAAPNLADYEAARAAFSWSAARAELSGLPAGGLNIAHEAVDRHVSGGRGQRVALRWLGKRGQREEYTYAELSELSSRFANLLGSLGVGAGEAVFSLLGRTPALYAAALGTLKNRSVFCPLFSAFGPEPIRKRLSLGAARVLVTSQALYERKVAGLRGALPELRHVIVTDGTRTGEGVLPWAEALSAAAPYFQIDPTDPELPALLHFTSGTTGEPKGALHVHEAVVMHHLTGRVALDLHGDDVYWCTADPGWVTGTSYGIVAPLTNGVTLVIDEAEFDAERWYSLLEAERVSVWYTAPTAIRLLMKAGADLVRGRHLEHLRFVASVGEPLNAEAVVWGQQVLGQPFHDNWWQTETGGIMIANFAAMDVRPGSMGKPMPGVEAAIVHRLEAGGVELVEQPGEQGELALRAGWPSMFRAYVGAPERYAACFRHGWYLTGDYVKRDADGYYWFVGRADDVIKSSGHLIGPSEVEGVLLSHPAVAEAGVIGRPDPLALEVVKAFVSLKDGHAPSADLERELIGFARQRLGSVAAPKAIAFLPELPKTESGKIMRRLLKAWELGLDEGDTSTRRGGAP